MGYNATRFLVYNNRTRATKNQAKCSQKFPYQPIEHGINLSSIQVRNKLPLTFLRIQ